MCLVPLSTYPENLFIPLSYFANNLQQQWLSHVLTQKFKFTTSQSECSVSTSTRSISDSHLYTAFTLKQAGLDWVFFFAPFGDLSAWNKKDISGCSTARSCISCPCCMSGWAAPASVLPPPAQKPRPSGSASDWGSPLPPTDYNPWERESNQHGIYEDLRLVFDVLSVCFDCWCWLYGRIPNKRLLCLSCSFSMSNVTNPSSSITDCVPVFSVFFFFLKKRVINNPISKVLLLMMKSHGCWQHLLICERNISNSGSQSSNMSKIWNNLKSGQLQCEEWV